MKRFAALLFFTVSAVPALAAGQGGYVAIDVGPATFSGADFGAANTGVSYPNPGSFHITGGYHFDQNLGVEGGIVSVGDSTVNTVNLGGSETLKTSVWYVAATGTFPVSNQFDLFGKLGLASTKIDYTTGGLFTPATFSGSKTNLMFGLGGQYNFNQNWGLRVQYENFGKTDISFPAGWFAIGPGMTKSIGLSTFTVGGVYNF